MFLVVVLLVLLLIIIIIIILPLIKEAHCKSKGPVPAPGPAAGLIPALIGYLFCRLQFHKSSSKLPYHIHLWKLSQRYGPLIALKQAGFFFGSSSSMRAPLLLVVSSSEMAKQILKTHDLSFCTRPSVVGQQKLSYGGMDIAFSPYNRHWKELRKICAHHVFSPKALFSFGPIRRDEVSRMIARIADESSKSAQPATVNLSQLAMSLSVNLICRAAFGRRYEDDEYDKMRFDRLIMEAQDLMVTYYFSDHFPPPFGDWMDKVRGISNRLQNNFEELDAFYQQIIDEHLIKASPSTPKQQDDDDDIVDLMIRFLRDDDDDDQKSSSPPLDLTWDHIKALLMNLFVAGTDTVAAAVVWTMTGLMLRPDIMKKTQSEVRRLMRCRRSHSNKEQLEQEQEGPEEGVVVMVGEEDLENLPYLKAVVLEALRLYPPAPLLFRTQMQDSPVVINGGYKIMPDTTVVINGWAIGRDPQTWPDPQEFKPERFLVNTTTSVPDDWELKMNMIPFGGGRRGCPGKEMGLISTQLALANLVYSFDWALEEGAILDMDSLPGLTTHKKIPLVLMPTKYN